MKQKLLAITAATFLLVACNNEEKTSESSTKDSTGAKTEKTDDSQKEQAWIPIDSAQAMNAMMAAGTLGEPHKMMAKSNGTWNAEMTMWEKTGGNPSTMKGTLVTTSILDGHYQQSTFSGDWMGMPFKGISTMGYDNVTKEYVSTWVENMSTGIMTMKGSWDNATNSLTMTGKQKNPANGLECNMREVYKIVDDNNHVMEMYGPDPQTGKEYKMMEMKYTRKK
ncbi:MAG TPA: DUF1579 domain-containing protein [Chitinophagaceae bacterium]|nr:DUF1579 domain-containing protein [Chitinophagaceae bacterium]